MRVVGSVVRAAQNRTRGPSVFERLRADEDAAADAVDQAAVASARSRKQRKTVSAVEDVAVEGSGGMSMKTGMVLARAKLAESASGILVAQDRQAALVGKGAYREAEKVAREGPVGMLATKEMPKRKELSKLRYESAFRKWMRDSLGAKVCSYSARLT